MNRWVLVCMLVAAVVRVGAATGLPMDADEPIYLASAERYAQALRSGRLPALLDQPHNPEHPALVKLMHGAALVPLGEDAGLVERLAVVRGVEAGGGVALAGLLALVHPAAGLAAALHTLPAKYTSQGYLEAWPMVFMYLALIAWTRVRRGGGTRWGLVLGLALGAAGAGKLIHALPGVVLILHLGWRRPRMLVPVLVAGLASLLALDPGLWLDPWGRFGGRLIHHAAYVPDVAAPWWLPFEALGGALVTGWHPDVFPFTLDPLWLGLGVWGLVQAGRRPGPRQALARICLVWVLVCLGVILAWHTRWAQHALVLLVPLCLGVGFWFESRLSPASPRSAPTGSRPPAGG